ncbi:MAG: CBS domain-containing protein [bacterium]
MLPVLDDDGRVAGIISDRDICMTAYMRGMPLEACSVGSAIAGDVVSCRPTIRSTRCRTPCAP